jgi:hypothetical protein
MRLQQAQHMFDWRWYCLVKINHGIDLQEKCFVQYKPDNNCYDLSF